MSTLTKGPVMLYTEQTPNPESLKFVTNRMLYPHSTADFREAELAQKWSPLATTLFEFPYVKGVYISQNYVTITKEFNYQWEDIMLKLKEYLKEYVEADKPIVNEGFEEVKAKIDQETLDNYEGDDKEIVTKIKNLIETYVKPAVEMDGGNIEFKSYKEGVVTVIMQGSCSGCPSSTVTLKAGIQGMLQRMVPEVTDVVSEMG